MPAHARAPPGSGSLPGLILFESGLTGMGYAKHTRSAIRIRTGLPMDPPRYPDLNRSSWTTNSCDCSSWTTNNCDCWVEPLQQFRPNRCNLSLGSDPSWSAINSAPVSHSKHTKKRKSLLSSLSSELEVSYCVLNWEVEF